MRAQCEAKWARLAAAGWLLVGLSACSEGNTTPNVGDRDGDSSGDGDSSEDGDSGVDGDSDGGEDGSGGDGAAADGSDGDGDAAVEECGALRATIRDFDDSHPDFEDDDTATNEVVPGIVEAELGADRTPVYAGTAPHPSVSGPDNFADWYHDTAGVNEPVEIEIELTQQGNGLYVYDNPMFFPIDGRARGNQNREHNYHFTTEIHTRFTYRGGEEFTFRGDDDLWMFVNGKLAMDLGGLHQPRMGSIDFDAMADELGIEIGKEYPMDIFHAERHTVESNFRIETSIACFTQVF
jgi:fibro-slime domain-containing protein